MLAQSITLPPSFFWEHPILERREILFAIATRE